MRGKVQACSVFSILRPITNPWWFQICCIHLMMMIVRKRNMAYQNGFSGKKKKKQWTFKRILVKCAKLLSRKVLLIYTSTSSGSEYTPNIIFQKFKIIFPFQEELRKLAWCSCSGNRKNWQLCTKLCVSWKHPAIEVCNQTTSCTSWEANYAVRFSIRCLIYFSS